MLRVLIVTALFLAAALATTAAISVAPPHSAVSHKSKATGGESAAGRLAQSG